MAASLQLRGHERERVDDDRRAPAPAHWPGLISTAFPWFAISAFAAAAQPFTNSFGMQLRPAPTAMSEVWAPAIVREAPTNEASMIACQDGRLEMYFITKPDSDAVSCMRSRDGGFTWDEPEIAFRLPGKAYYAVAVLQSPDGARHAVFHILAMGAGGYRGRLYEVYYTKQPRGASAWSEPKKIVPGYIGSINGFIQLGRTGRLVLAVARAVPEREKPPSSGPDFGWNDTVVHFSDDGGATWRESPDRLRLELATRNVTRYGAIEPCLLELRDGRVWMLVRDRGGRLWQSFSADGGRWEPLTRTGFISSDSPADLLRLRNGKILLLTNACQNWSDPRSYAIGGREVLHAAISDDDGRRWRGFREILHETAVVSRGDRGTSYASPVENAAGKIVVVSGQGEGKRAILVFDPRWLEESEVRDDLRAGPVQWTQYGAADLRVERHEGGSLALAIPTATPLGGALWNFPSAEHGELTFRIKVPRGARGVRLCLNDHFNRIDDTKAAENAVYAIDWSGLALTTERWHDVKLRWNEADRGGELNVEIDGRVATPLRARRPAQFGVNHLRVEFGAVAESDPVLLAGVAARRLSIPRSPPD